MMHPFWVGLAILLLSARGIVGFVEDAVWMVKKKPGESSWRWKR